DRRRARAEGGSILEPARSGARDAALAALADLARRPDLPGPLAHHLALAFMRQAEDEDAPHPASWQGARTAWLTFLASDDAPPLAARDLLLDHLLALHRR